MCLQGVMLLVCTQKIQKTNITLRIDTHTFVQSRSWAYQGVRNASFSENTIRTKWMISSLKD